MECDRQLSVFPEITQKTLLAPTSNVTPGVGALGVLSPGSIMDRTCGYGPQGGGSIPSRGTLVASCQFDTTTIMTLTGIIWGIRQIGKAAVMSGLEQKPCQQFLQCALGAGV